MKESSQAKAKSKAKKKKKKKSTFVLEHAVKAEVILEDVLAAGKADAKARLVKKLGKKIVRNDLALKRPSSLTPKGTSTSSEANMSMLHTSACVPSSKGSKVAKGSKLSKNAPIVKGAKTANAAKGAKEVKESNRITCVMDSRVHSVEAVGKGRRVMALPTIHVRSNAPDSDAKTTVKTIRRPKKKNAKKIKRDKRCTLDTHDMNTDNAANNMVTAMGKLSLSNAKPKRRASLRISVDENGSECDED